MRNKNELSVRRKHKRFKVPIDTFAIVKNQSFKLGQIADMSKGGISFYYTGEKEFGNQELAVGILLAVDDFYLDNLSANIVSNIIVPVQASIRKATFKRCGLKFKNLSPGQISKLSYFASGESGGFLKDQRVA